MLIWPFIFVVRSSLLITLGILLGSIQVYVWNFWILCAKFLLVWVNFVKLS